VEAAFTEAAVAIPVVAFPAAVIRVGDIPVEDIAKTIQRTVNGNAASMAAFPVFVHNRIRSWLLQSLSVKIQHSFAW
jgi:type IV secretory pathway VirB2 component (pilin)